MNFKTDVTRQSLIIYSGLALSSCLGLLSGFILILHIPLMSRSYKFAIYLNLNIYKLISTAMMSVAFTCLFSSIMSFAVFLFFISIKVRRTLWKILRPAYLVNCLFLLANLYNILMMIDGIGTLKTDIQYKFQAKMRQYGNNDSDASKYNINKDTIDRIQQKTKCCGITGPTDWFNIKWLTLEEQRSLREFRYMNQIGLVALAPMSCCDRRKALFCPLRDKNALIRYFSEGCRLKLSEQITSQLLSTEVVLCAICFFILIVLTVLFSLTSSSIKSMISGVYGHDIGQASVSNMIPTRHLELQSRGTPLLMPPEKDYQPFLLKKHHYIESKMKIGAIIEGTPYLRYVREHYPVSGIQKFLKIYFPIVERAIFDVDPSYKVVIFRFFGKAFVGSQIAHLFLTAFSTAIEGQTKVSHTIKDVVIYSTYVSFTFAFIKSTKFRAIAILLIPNLGMKTGRAFLMAELARITAMGPLSSIAGNLQAVMMSLHCSMGIALNISRDVQRITTNPMRKLILQTVESSDSLKRATLDVYNASRPVTEDIDDSEERAKRIRKNVESGKSTREVNLKNRFTKVLHQLDRMEQRKFQQKTQKLRDQYAILKEQFQKSMVQIDKYKDVFGNKSSQIVSQMRTKMFSGCSSIEQMKTQLCQKTIAAACGVIQRLATGNINIGIDVKSLCYSEIDSDSSCNVKKAIERTKKCANEKEAANAKDGFGGMHQGTKDGLSAMQEIFDFKVNWKFDRKKFNVDGDTVLHGTAVLTFSLSDGITVFVDLLILLMVILKILLMLVIFRSFTYCKKFLTDLDYDNKYVTSHFEYIDQQRKLSGRSSLLPLKSYERKNVLYKQTFYTSEELKKVINDLIKISVIGMSLGIPFMVSDAFYEALIIIREVSLIKLSVRSDEALNITTKGDGIIKNLMDIMLDEIKSLGRFNVTYSLEDCAPNVISVSAYFRNLFVTILGIIFFLTAINGYLVRSRHVICGYFYPKRERQRIVHLFNSMLLGRKRYMRTKKNMVIHKVRQNRLEAEYSFLLSLRRDFPIIFGWLKAFSKLRCLICDNKEDKDFFVCQEDYSPFCKECFNDIGNVCLVCFILDVLPANDNVSNYYESQYMSPNDTSEYSTSGHENSDIEASREVVGWSRHPVEVLQEEVILYKALMNELK